ncbi:MAG: HDOD domain-containing protein [Gammaproteobacteria bacterium]|nr:MAG: HDOD domain-containing protein [Gammaproteobacteria bacterium]
MRKTIESQADGELNPIAQIRPCIYDIDAASEVKYIKIYTDQLTEFAQQLEQRDSDDIDVFTIEQSAQENELTIQLFQDLMTGNVALPSLPDVAQRIQQAFSQKAVNVGVLANIIHSDPAITAKLIMISNSVLYRGQDHIDTLNQAIVRLGLETTQKQVMTYAVNELFREKSSAMKAKMQKLWKHSQKVASLSRILARKSKLFDPSMAQLAGLIHDLGEIAILQYAQEHTEMYDDDNKLPQAIRALRPQITSMLLHKWNFSDELVTVGEESEDWFRNPQDEADLCDLVMIAQYHSFIGTPEMKNLPPISKLPALAKLGMDELGPKESIEFLKQSKQEIQAIEALLA